MDNFLWSALLFLLLATIESAVGDLTAGMVLYDGLCAVLIYRMLKNGGSIWKNISP